MIDTLRICLDCNIEKECSEFFGKAKGKFCLSCRRKRAREQSRLRSSEEQRGYFIKYKYGITLEEYKKMWDNQNGLCAICHESETRKNKYTGINLLCVDHNHLTGKVRGLLCSKCNCAIGYFRDNPKLIELGLQYLKSS